MTSSVLVVAPGAFAATAAAVITDLIGAAVDVRGGCAIALSGGNTPVPVLQDLIGRTIRWRQVAIYFGDERAVPPDHPDSNFAMARQALLDHVPVPEERVHRMAAEREDRDVAAREYEAILPPELDLLLLGVGPDGHTASLFPGSAALFEPGRRVLAVPAPLPPLQPPVDRMTITPPVIAAARQIVVLVRGADKAALLRRVLHGPDCPEEFPAQLARAGIWIVDDAAAQQLQPGDH